MTMDTLANFDVSSLPGADDIFRKKAIQQYYCSDTGEQHKPVNLGKGIYKRR